MIKAYCFLLIPLVPICVGSGCELFWTHCTLEKVHSRVFISTFHSFTQYDSLTPN